MEQANGDIGLEIRTELCTRDIKLHVISIDNSKSHTRWLIQEDKMASEAMQKWPSYDL